MKVFFAKLSVLTSMLLLYGATSVWAQGKGKISFSGTVQASETEGGGNSKITPLAYAVVSLPEIGVATTTDVKGRFEIQLSNPGKYKVEISSLGYEPLSQTIQLPARDSLKFTLKATSFYLENIVVSAESKKTGAATASKISKSAMEHIQATSLADIMSLLPGASTRTAEEIALKKVSTFSVRNGQSFGTAIIMDGAPLSNNANMQTLSLALGAGAGPSISTPNSGVDMRTITTNNIESVEVIRGIASAQYGDIASGAVIVNSKAGRTPLSIQLDVNPNVYMASVSHGVGLGRKAGVLNYGVDYTFAQYDPTEGYDTYNRVTGRVSYSNTVGKWSTNTSFNLFYTKDKAEPNPDDARDLDLMTQRDLGLRFNTNGSFNFNKNWLKNLKYTVSANYTNKKHTGRSSPPTPTGPTPPRKPTEPFFRACPDRIFTWPTVRKSRTSPMPTRTHPRCRQERQSLAPAVGLYGHIQPVRQGAQHLRAAVGQFRRRPGTHSPPADHRRRVPRHGQPGRRQGLRSGDSAAPLGQHQLHHPARTRFQRRAVHAPVQPLRRGVFLDGHPAPQAGNRRRRPL